jgi:hypothetical protein
MRDAYAATSMKILTGIMVGASRLGEQLRAPSPTISFNTISTYTYDRISAHKGSGPAEPFRDISPLDL